MKKFLLFIICTLLFFALCGCDETSDTPVDKSDKPDEVTTEVNNTEESDTKDDFYREHQELVEEEVDFDDDTMLRVSLSDVGLENVIIKSVELGKIDEDSFGTVYLLADDRYGGSTMPADHYLAIAISDKIIVKDLSAWENQACYSGDIELRDFDGDSDNEILLQECLGGVGGAGSYVSRVFDFKNGEIVKMFSSLRSENDHRVIDTGFSIDLLENHRFEIRNTITGYSETFQDEREYEEYYKWWYTDEGKLRKDLNIMVDSFCEFVPVDIDGDHTYEIRCRQYVSLVGHSDGIGWAVTVLKYNNELSCFEIVEATFEHEK